MLTNTRRYSIMYWILSFLTISSFVFITYAWFTTKLEQNLDYDTNMGLVDVGINVYFHDGTSFIKNADFVEIAPGVYKTGVYYIDIDSADADEFIENLRVDIQVNSNIPTYIRVKIHKQLTLIYTDFQGNISELSIYINDKVEQEFQLNYDLENWFIDSYSLAYYHDASNNIRDYAGNLVYQYVSPGIYTDPATQTEGYYLTTAGDVIDDDENLVIRAEILFDTQDEAIGFRQRNFNYIYYDSIVSTQTTIPLILEYLGVFGTYPDGYSLQIAFEVEAVQALGGPENVWGLATPPWGGSW